MKLIVQKNELLGLLAKTQNIVEKRNAMPILVNILIEVQNGTMSVFATDLEVSLTDSIPVQVQQPGKIAINAKSLFEVVKELGDGPVQLTKRESNWMEISQGKYQSKMIGLNPDEYPIFPTYQGSGFVKIDAQMMKDMIDKTIYSVSTDETRYYLNGVYFEQSPDLSCTMVATDGHRLSLVHRKVEVPHSLTQNGVIIPRKGLNEIRKLIENVDGDLEIAIEGAQLIVRHKSTVLMIRLIEGKYPKYQQFIPQKLTQKVKINREAFLSSLRRVSLLANYKSKAVTLSLGDGRLEITSNNPEIGDAKEELEVDYTGKNLKIGFNAKYITDILNTIDDDEVQFEVNDQLSPGLLRPANDANYTCVIMPMRI